MTNPHHLLSSEALLAAFALPPGPPPQRIAKTVLTPHAPTPADRRLIDKCLTRLDWNASLNPGSISVAAGEHEGLPVSTINLFTARTRGPMPPRLREMIHRLVPVPVILIHASEEEGAAASLSLAAKRPAEREEGRVVVTAMYDSGPVDDGSPRFVEALALAQLPSRHLGALYAGLIERVEALRAARTAQRPYRLAESDSEAQRWRDALTEHDRLSGVLAGLAARMKKEAVLARRVELGEEASRIKREIAAILDRLA